MSRQSGKKYFVARKKPKLYMTGVFDVTVNSITTEGEQHLYLDTAEAEQMKGKKVIIVDASASMMAKTGNTTRFEKAMYDIKGEVSDQFEVEDGKVSKRYSYTVLNIQL